MIAVFFCFFQGAFRITDVKCRWLKGAKRGEARGDRLRVIMELTKLAEQETSSLQGKSKFLRSSSECILSAPYSIGDVK